MRDIRDPQEYGENLLKYAKEYRQTFKSLAPLSEIAERFEKLQYTEYIFDAADSRINS